MENGAEICSPVLGHCQDCVFDADSMFLPSELHTSIICNKTDLCV